MKKNITIVKVGGKIVEEETSLNLLLERFSQIKGYKLLVHGGGRTATALAAQMGVETHMVDGRRITDADMLRIVTMTYAGLVNKNLVAKLSCLGIRALGLTGADMDVMRSHKRPVGKIDYGYVGDVEQTNGEELALLIERGIVPVMAPLTHDGKGQLLNTNADTIASETAKSLAKYFDVTLVYCFEKKGVLRNAEDEDSVISRITLQDFVELQKQGVIEGGMIPKLSNSFAALDAGVNQVVITRVDQLSVPNTGTVVCHS